MTSTRKGRFHVAFRGIKAVKKKTVVAEYSSWTDTILTLVFRIALSADLLKMLFVPKTISVSFIEVDAVQKPIFKPLYFFPRLFWKNRHRRFFCYSLCSWDLNYQSGVIPSVCTRKVFGALSQDCCSNTTELWSNGLSTLTAHITDVWAHYTQLGASKSRSE